MSTPTTLFLLRHGEVEDRYHRVFGGRIDMELSPLGHDQAAKLARTTQSLLVVAAPGGGSVQPGDLILNIDGQPPLPEVLARKRLTGVPVQVRVGRGGNERDAVIP